MRLLMGVKFSLGTDRGNLSQGSHMKMVEAIVKPSKLNEVKEALTKAGVQGMSDHGLQPGQF